jgi:hypothetical protein
MKPKPYGPAPAQRDTRNEGSYMNGGAYRRLTWRRGNSDDKLFEYDGL